VKSSDDGAYPNNETCPLLLYQQCQLLFNSVTPFSTEGISKKLKSNKWKEPWLGQVYEYQHYHSTVWEGLWCNAGSADIQMGGPNGSILSVKEGDFILIPPGVSHKQISATDDFSLLGTYIHNSGPVDEIRNSSEPAPTELLENIKQCLIPYVDPVGGDSSPWGGIKNLFE